MAIRAIPAISINSYFANPEARKIRRDTNFRKRRHDYGQNTGKPDSLSFEYLRPERQNHFGCNRHLARLGDRNRSAAHFGRGHAVRQSQARRGRSRRDQRIWHRNGGSTAMTYPKTLFKADGGNWKHQQVHSVDGEEFILNRHEGYFLPNNKPFKVETVDVASRVFTVIED